MEQFSTAMFLPSRETVIKYFYCISLSLEETALNPHLALRYKSQMTTTDQ